MNINHILEKDIINLSKEESVLTVDNLIDRLKTEFSKQDKSAIYGVTQRLLAYNSNKIEGSTLTEKQTASLFETGTILASGEILRAKDVEETRGHFMMFNEMLNTHSEPLSEELIKKYHFRLKSGVFEDIANGYPIGEYKNRKNIVSDIATASPEEVQSKMSKLLTEYESEPVKDLSKLTEFHSNYEKIHPFQDGNGRTGRILLFKECLRQRIIPFVIMDENKAIYYSALNQAQNEQDYAPLTKMFEKEQQYYYSLIKSYLYIYN